MNSNIDYLHILNDEIENGMVPEINSFRDYSNASLSSILQLKRIHIENFMSIILKMRTFNLKKEFG